MKLHKQEEDLNLKWQLQATISWKLFSKRARAGIRREETIGRACRGSHKSQLKRWYLRSMSVAPRFNSLTIFWLCFGSSQSVDKLKENADNILDAGRQKATKIENNEI